MRTSRWESNPNRSVQNALSSTITTNVNLSDGPRDRRPPKIRPRVHGGHPPEVLELLQQGFTLLQSVHRRLEHLLFPGIELGQDLIRVDVDADVGGRLAARLELVRLLHEVLKSGFRHLKVDLSVIALFTSFSSNLQKVFLNGFHGSTKFTPSHLYKVFTGC